MQLTVTGYIIMLHNVTPLVKINVEVEKKYCALCYTNNKISREKAKNM